MGKKVAIEVDGVVTVHMEHTTGNYATLCGIDGDDPGCNQYPVALREGAKIDCPDCRMIWSLSMKYKKCEFSQ